MYWKWNLVSPYYLLRRRTVDRKENLWQCGYRSVRRSECCFVMKQIRVQALPGMKMSRLLAWCWITWNVLNGITILVWIDGDRNITDGRIDLEPSLWYPVYRRVSWRQYIEINCRVFNYALTMLEPYEVKVSCTVLRGLGAGNSPRLPDTPKAGSGFRLF